VFAYAPESSAGTGFALVTDRFVALTGPEMSDDVAAALYELLDADGTSIDDVLDVIATQVSVERLAVVQIIDPESRTFHVAVLGDVSVDMEGVTASRLSGTTTAWVSSEARGVRSLRLALDDEPVAARLPIRRGVVATRSIRVGRPETAPRSYRAAAAPGTRPITLPRPEEISADAEARSERVASGWVLTLPDGTELGPERPVVFGRRPWSAETTEQQRAGEQVVHVVAPSPQREISGAHLELSLSDEGLRARDLDSTNGTLVITPEKVPRLLHEGRSTTLRSGDILDLGEQFRVVIGTRG